MASYGKDDEAYSQSSGDSDSDSDSDENVEYVPTLQGLYEEMLATLKDIYTEKEAEQIYAIAMTTLKTMDNDEDQIKFIVSNLEKLKEKQAQEEDKEHYETFKRRLKAVGTTRKIHELLQDYRLKLSGDKMKRIMVHEYLKVRHGTVNPLKYEKLMKKAQDFSLSQIGDAIILMKNKNTKKKSPRKKNKMRFCKELLL